MDNKIIAVIIAVIVVVIAGAFLLNSSSDTVTIGYFMLVFLWFVYKINYFFSAYLKHPQNNQATPPQTA